MDVGPGSDDLHDLIDAAQAKLAQAGEVPAMRKDPYRLVLGGLSKTLGVFGQSVTRWERAVGAVIAARDPLPKADRAALIAELVTAAENGAYNGMRKEANRMVRTLDRRLMIQVGLGIGAAFVLGALSVLVVLIVMAIGPFSREAEGQAAWKEIIQNNPDPRRTISTATVQADHNGRRYYTGIRLWLDAPPAP